MDVRIVLPCWLRPTGKSGQTVEGLNDSERSISQSADRAGVVITKLSCIESKGNYC